MPNTRPLALMNVFILLKESVRSAIQALKLTPLRTLLSSLGIIIGIFCIIGIFTIVDSFERKVKEEFASFTNSGRIFVSKWPWLFTDNYPWWKFFRRPYPNYQEYTFIKQHAENAGNISMYAGIDLPLSHKENTIYAHTQAISYAYNEMEVFPIKHGRYFSSQEAERAQNVVILGSKLVQELFPPYENPIGQKIKVKRRDFTVVGTLEPYGQSIARGASIDEVAYIPIKALAKMYRLGQRRRPWTTILVDPKTEQVDVHNLAAEVKTLMRVKRGLAPRKEDNFAINKSEHLTQQIEALKKLFSIVGGIIGGFSMLVGAFNIANIMFISVKERTFQIGLQKALGARKAFILSQFLCETIIITLMGGSVGLCMVYLFSFVPLGPFDPTLTWGNMLIGIGLCLLTGLVSGLSPAYRAAMLDPVAAMREK